MRKQYEMPVIHLLDGADTDLIRTSTLNHATEGNGDTIWWNELYDV